MPRHHHLQLVVVLLTAAFLLAACSNDSSSNKNVYTLTELEAAIEHRFNEYEWPPGFNISADAIIENLDFPPGSYIEIPGEYTYLGTYHTCAWEITLLQAVDANDKALAKESLYQLVEFGQNHSPIKSDEHGKAAKKTMYNSAMLGDSADLQRWVNNNCEFVMPYFEDADAAVPASLARRNIDRS